MILIIGGAWQGKTELAHKMGFKDDEILNCFHLKIKKCIEDGGSTAEFTDSVLNGGYRAVISDEIGCGIIPLDKEERIWREETGRALCKTAAACDEVWLVRCGIGTKIKG